MKRKIKRTFRSCVSMLLVLCMVIGFFPASVFADDGGAGKETINYVSLGDSMTNGYGFNGYKQTEDKPDYDVLNGVGTYGDAAYPNQFATYLEECGYNVNHAKLALSATLAEDLLYMLGGREEAQDGWGGLLDYMGDYDKQENLPTVKKYYQDSIANADIISMCLGNASFGAYLLNRITDALGVLDGKLDDDEKVTLQDALSVVGLDEEQMALVNQVYAYLVENLLNQIPAEYATKYNVEEICNLITYATASFLVNYKLSIDKILELNNQDDLEIILVGMMNTTYGMVITMDDGSQLPIGDIMDTVFDLLNAYVAGLPAAMQLAGQWQDATFYYAEQDHITFICQQFKELKANNWADIDGLSGATVRDRNISAYNGSLREVIGGAFSLSLPQITLADVEDYESSKPSFNGTAADAMNISIAIYLAIEGAVAESTDTLEIPAESLMTIANDISSVFQGVSIDPGSPEGIRTSLEAYLKSTDVLQGMCKIYALFKVGNGMSVHPDPAAHDELAKRVIEAYAAGHTAQDQTMENLKAAMDLLQGLAAEYYDDACIYAYNYAVENGYVDMAVAALDELMVQLKALEDAYGAKVQATVDTAIAQLEEAKAILENTVSLGKDTLDQILDLMEAVNEALQNLGGGAVATISLEETSTDATLDAAIAEIQAAVQAAMAEISAKLEEAIGVGTDMIMTYAQDALRQLAEATAALAQEYAPEAADYIYNWLYNNPETVIAFVNAYGDDAAAFMAEYGQYAMQIMGYILYNYGEDVANAVLDNADEILATLVEWYQIHGENTWALIQVYLEELGIIDAIEDSIDAATKAVQEILAKLDAAIYGQVIDNVDDLMAMLDELVAKAEALEVDITAQIQALNQAIAELQAALEIMAAQGTEAAKAALNQAVADIEAAVNDLVAKLNEKGAELDAQIKAQIDALKAQIEAKIDELTAMADQAYADLNQALKDLSAMLDQISGEAYEQLVAELDVILAELDAIMDKAQNIGATAQAELENLYAAVEEFQRAAERFVNEGAAAANADLQAAVAHVAAAVENVLYAISEDASAQAAGILADVNQLLGELYLSATHATISGCEDKLYVAIGDDTVLGENSYADKLAEELGFASKTKVAASGLMIQDSAALIQANAQAIAQADLITLGFGNATFINDAVNVKLSNLMLGVENTYDWSSIVTEEGVQYVEQALKALEEQLEEAGISGNVMGLDTKLALMTIIESYIYDAAAYAVGVPKLVESIHKINPEVLVTIVGMYNPFKGVTLDLDGTTVDLGEYLDYLVAGVTAHGIAYCMMSGNAIFVEAPAVEVANTMTEMTMTNLVAQIIYYMNNFYPTETGHEYIKNQILGALTISDEHDLHYVEAAEKTCTTDGCEAHYKCRVCGKLFKDAQGQEETTLEDLCIPAGHSLTKVKKLDPTCTVAGHNEYYVCEVCDAAFKDDQAKTATTVEAETIKAKGHKETVKNAKKATCTAKGYTGDTVCTTCQKVLEKGTEIKATGHKWDKGVITTPATYDKTGVMTYTCQNDSTHTRTETIAALCDHTLKNCPLGRFSDTEIEAWYHDGLHYCIENDLMNGFPDGTFRPGDENDETSYATRAQVVTVLWRLAGSPEVNQKLTFSDVEEGAWYMPALRWAVKNNVVEGYPDNTFKPNDQINRQTAATLFCRYFTGKLDAPVTGAVKNSGLKDYNKLHPWAEGYMDWAFENGLFIGFEDNTLRPLESTTRAQLATLLFRYLNQ